MKVGSLGSGEVGQALGSGFVSRGHAHALLALLLVALPLAAATRPAAEQVKIDWLLSEIEHSNAVFLRNGAEYAGPKAAAHLKMKLAGAGKRVQTARGFILGVCSHSKASGKPYEIRFKDGVQRPLDKWLTERLDAFEKRPSPGNRRA